MKNSSLLFPIIIISFLMLIFSSSSLFAKTLRIMPLGDSVTYGGDFTHVGAGFEDYSVAYRGFLWTKLKQNGYDINFVGSQKSGSDYLAIDDSFDVDNEGHNGFRADQIAQNIQTYLKDNPADIILLHIGTNDFDQGNTTITQTVLDVEDILKSVDTVSKEIKVIVAKIINKQTNDHNITDYNNQLEVMVSNRISNGDNIVLVDMEKEAGIDYATEMIDNLHPNEKGYTKIANAWYAAITKNTHNSPPQTISSDSVSAWSIWTIFLLNFFSIWFVFFLKQKKHIRV